MKYLVQVRFAGTREYEIEADSPWDAETLSMEEFSKDDPVAIFRYCIKDAFPDVPKVIEA